MRPRRGGGAVIALERRFALEDASGEITELDELWHESTLRFNEGGCDPAGRFYCGSMAYDKTPGAASMYRLNADLTVDRILDNLTISNGIEWSPDNSLAYYNDTATGAVSVFDYEDGELKSRRTFATIPGRGRPDGLTVDSEGGVWIALPDRGEVWRFTPAGEKDEVIEVAARKVTACTFGGDDLDELFITTSRENVPPGTDPLAGALFHARPRVRGLPVREFAG
jgi:sugar lactone lactonase YvrE